MSNIRPLERNLYVPWRYLGGLAQSRAGWKPVVECEAGDLLDGWFSFVRGPMSAQQLWKVLRER